MNEWTLPGTLVVSTDGGASVVSIFHLVFYFFTFGQQGFLGVALDTHHDIGLVEF